MRRPAFALIEVLVTVGIMSIVTALTIPLYREYQIRSDLDNATQQATQGLARAKILSQTGKGDAQWGYFVPAGTLYRGSSYALRNAAYDEVFPMPSTIAVSGLLDVSYSKVQGIPSATGSILLKALNDDERVIQVTIAIQKGTVATNQGDTFTICYQNQTLVIPDSTWPSYQAQGATMGACAAGSSSSTSSTGSSSSASALPDSCAKFTIKTDGSITTTAATSVTFTNMESKITFGQGGPQVPVHVCYSTDNDNFSPLFGGSGQCSGSNGNAYGNAVAENGTDTASKSLSNNNPLSIIVNGNYKYHGWLTFNESFQTDDGTDHIHLMLNGDSISDFPGFYDQTDLQDYLEAQGKANASGTITIGSCEILMVAELGDLRVQGADYDDDVMVMSFN